MATSKDLDTNLLQQFSCLGTTDRDVLISQFQKVIGYQINASECAFFLDMNNWNLQAAVCSYFDCDAPKSDLPSMSFVQDVTIGEGEAIPPNTRFVKTWKIQNTGIKRWPPNCNLQFVSGFHMGHFNYVAVESLRPEETADVSVEMISPSTSGTYMGQWRMVLSSTGQYFGDMIYVIVTVQEGGLMGVTQQMDAFNQLGSPPKAQPLANPFAAIRLKCAGPNPSTAQFQNGDYQNPSMSEDSNSHQSVENGSSAFPSLTEVQNRHPEIVVHQGEDPSFNHSGWENENGFWTK